jgi:hypothetical protein
MRGVSIEYPSDNQRRRDAAEQACVECVMARPRLATLLRRPARGCVIGAVDIIIPVNPQAASARVTPGRGTADADPSSHTIAGDYLLRPVPTDMKRHLHACRRSLCEASVSASTAAAMADRPPPGRQSDRKHCAAVIRISSGVAIQRCQAKFDPRVSVLGLDSQADPIALAQPSHDRQTES